MLRRLLLLAVLAAVGAAVAWAYSKRETVSKMARLMRENGRTAREALNAPGAREVQALGCNTAAVMDMRRIYAIAGIADAGTAMDLIVTCNLRQGMEAPSCSDVAEAYTAAVGEAPSPFLAVVRREETNQRLCEAAYSADGSPL